MRIYSVKLISKLSFVGIALSLTLVACKDSSKQTVHLGSFSRAVDYAPYLVAKELGWFDDSLKAKGFNVSYTEYSNPGDISDAFKSNLLDVVFEAEPPAIIHKSSGADISIQNISCNLVQQILVHTNSSINGVADLKDKKIAVMFGSSSHYALLKMLSGQNVNLVEQKDILDLGPDDARTSFKQNQIDAWAVWPPNVEEQEVNGTGRTLPGGDQVINSIMTVNNQMIRKNPLVLQTINNVFENSKRWIQQHPDSAISIITRVIYQSDSVGKKDIIAKAWPKHNWNVKLDERTVNDIQNKADFLFSRKMIEHSVKILGDLVPKYQK